MHPNALGSNSNTTDWKGQTNGEQIYDPWGHQLVTGGQAIRFAGMSHRDQTGFDVTPNRDYSNTLGRWLTPDPGGLKVVTLADPQTWNKYVYVRNNPTTLTDPSGLEVDLGDNKNKAKKLLLKNVSRKERKVFVVVKNSDTGRYELKIKTGANVHGEHTVGFSRLAIAIGSDKTLTVNVSKTYTDPNGQTHDVAREFGGGVTIPEANGNSTVYVSPKGNPYQLQGTEGQRIADPVNIIMGHETLGHGLENMIGGDTSQGRAIEIENELRREQGKPERAQDQD